MMIGGNRSKPRGGRSSVGTGQIFEEGSDEF